MKHAKAQATAVEGPYFMETLTPLVFVEPGIYQHYKGNYYQVLDMARHSETLEPMVIYQALYGDFGIWVRPAGMFTEQVMIDNQEIQRFKRIVEETLIEANKHPV